MANSLVVFPYRDDEQGRAWLREQGIALPAGEGRLPAVARLEEILRTAGWPFTARHADGTWSADFLSREGRWPPISQLTLLDGAIGFRLGPTFGPFHVAREVARSCGPQVAVEASGAATCLVLTDTTYEEFHLRITGVAAPEDRSDRGWA